MRAVNAFLGGLAIFSLAVAAQGKSLRYFGGPAETPPASYKGNQFVDSNGCIFVRAGYNGNVSWIPRVKRNKQVVCGYKPTAIAGMTPAKPAKTGETKTVRLVATAQTAPAAPSPAIRKKHASFNWNWFGPNRKKAKPTITIAAVAPAAASATKPKVETAEAPAPKLYRGHYVIRHVPQQNHPGDLFNGRKSGTATAAVQVTRTQPQPVLPKGYTSLLAENARPAQRGVGTPEGQAAMDLIWTQTMPRRLIDVTTGRDMTAQLPQIIYPYTTVSTRTYAANTVAGSAPRKKRVIVDPASPLNMKKIEDVSALTATALPKVRPVAAAVRATFPFVQIATFGVPR